MASCRRDVGIAAPFWVNAFSNLGVIGALSSGVQPRIGAIPAPRSTSAMRCAPDFDTLDTTRTSARLDPRTGSSFASAYWALLPLVARRQIAGGPALYGLLLGAIGARPWAAHSCCEVQGEVWRRAAPFNRHYGSAVATGLFALAHDAEQRSQRAHRGSIVDRRGVEPQRLGTEALPDWVRGRGLAIYVTVMFGALTLGSAIWGELGALRGYRCLLLAAGGVIVAIPLTRAWKLQTSPGDDFSPSMHWPAPVTTRAVEPDRGPVLVTVEYHIDPKNREISTRARTYARARRRDGAYDWGIFEDPAQEGRFIETFLKDSWLEHLRQHQRVTKADRMLEPAVRRFQVGEGPKTTHLIGAQPRR